MCEVGLGKKCDTNDWSCPPLLSIVQIGIYTVCGIANVDVQGYIKTRADEGTMLITVNVRYLKQRTFFYTFNCISIPSIKSLCFRTDPFKSNTQCALSVGYPSHKIVYIVRIHEY